MTTHAAMAAVGGPSAVVYPERCYWCDTPLDHPIDVEIMPHWSIRVCSRECRLAIGNALLAAAIAQRPWTPRRLRRPRWWEFWK